MVALALTKSGYEADFSPASLWEIDRFFDEETRKGEPRRWGLLAKETSLRLFSVGAYVGEVVRREAGGEWEADDADEQAELNLALRFPDGRMAWPVQQAVRRMRDGEKEAIVPYAAELGVDAGPRSPSAGGRSARRRARRRAERRSAVAGSRAPGRKLAERGHRVALRSGDKQHRAEPVVRRQRVHEQLEPDRERERLVRLLAAERGEVVLGSPCPRARRRR